MITVLQIQKILLLLFNYISHKQASTLITHKVLKCLMEFYVFEELKIVYRIHNVCYSDASIRKILCLRSFILDLRHTALAYVNNGVTAIVCGLLNRVRLFLVFTQ